MIPRYTRQEMSDIWSEENKYKIWFEIEAYACEAQSELGIIPKESVQNIWQKGKFDINKINEIEKTTKHDVIAFLTNVAEYVGEDSRFIHLGMTSSDVVDTCFSVQLKQASEILIQGLEKLLIILKRRAYEHKDTICMGRSHGIHAEPITFGLKFAYAYAEFSRHLKRLKGAQQEISVCAISGAVGTFANIDPFVQEYVAKKMNLISESISTQVIPRDRHAAFFTTLALISSSIERLAIEIRHLQRTEVLEAEEFFSEGQKGSSAMPHKRNPIMSENISGLARLVRSYALPAMENIALWHERDISHSSVERVIGPDSTQALDFAIHRLISIIDNLIIYPENMKKNIAKSYGLIFSQRVLLALTQKHLSREEAYQIVQTIAMKSWKESKDFKGLLLENTIISKYLTNNEIEDLCDTKHYITHVNNIFESVFKG
ncbi:Adenylosuccinate lyase [Rickettsiales bacterium Ac37b]|nr:Adenylosuccinate lyase [Rickettsiales bacterium Ac37b]